MARDTNSSCRSRSAKTTRCPLAESCDATGRRRLIWPKPPPSSHATSTVRRLLPKSQFSMRRISRIVYRSVILRHRQRSATQTKARRVQHDGKGHLSRVEPWPLSAAQDMIGPLRVRCALWRASAERLNNQFPLSVEQPIGFVWSGVTFNEQLVLIIKPEFDVSILSGE